MPETKVTPAEAVAAVRAADTAAYRADELLELTLRGKGRSRVVAMMAEAVSPLPLNDPDDRWHEFLLELRDPPLETVPDYSRSRTVLARVCHAVLDGWYVMESNERDEWSGDDVEAAFDRADNAAGDITMKLLRESPRGSYSELVATAAAMFEEAWDA